VVRLEGGAHLIGRQRPLEYPHIIDLPIEVAIGRQFAVVADTQGACEGLQTQTRHGPARDLAPLT
jgi:hypothetical protein